MISLSTNHQISQSVNQTLIKSVTHFLRKTRSPKQYIWTKSNFCHTLLAFFIDTINKHAYLGISQSIWLKRPFLEKGYANFGVWSIFDTIQNSTKTKSTWMALWSWWEARQRAQRAPLKQSKQNILHSLLWALGWFLHWPKNLVSKSGLSHGGHLLSSSSFTPWIPNDQKL